MVGPGEPERVDGGIRDHVADRCVGFRLADVETARPLGGGGRVCGGRAPDAEHVGIAHGAERLQVKARVEAAADRGRHRGALPFRAHALAPRRVRPCAALRAAARRSSRAPRCPRSRGPSCPRASCRSRPRSGRDNRAKNRAAGVEPRFRLRQVADVIADLTPVCACVAAGKAMAEATRCDSASSHVKALEDRSFDRPLAPDRAR